MGGTMKWGAIAVAAVLAASPAQAAEPTLQDQAKALLARPPSPDALFRLKEDMGSERFKALKDVIFRQIFSLPEGKPGEQTVVQACIADPAKAKLFGLSLLALETDDEGQWHARLAEADGALAKRAALQAAAGEKTEQALRGSGAASDPWRAELARRVGRDQFARTTLPDLSPPGGWTDGVSAPARRYLNALASTEMCAIDQDNTAWLKAALARRGWPLISRDGKDADNQAWLLVQHADMDPAWQAQVLAQLTDLAPKGETNVKNYAYLFDRVAMKHGGPQRYGTQGHCVGAGKWSPFDDEPGDLDARRATVGLPSEADYIAVFKTICQRADGA
jgi:hypothetical protein